MLTGPAASAAPKSPRTTTLAKGLIGPLRVAVAPEGVYVAESFKGTITLVRPGKKPKVVYAVGDGGEVGAVSYAAGQLTFTLSPPEPEGAPRVAARKKAATTPASPTLYRMDTATGKVRKVADLGAFEAAHNPDGAVSYGFTDLPADCAAQLPAELGPATHTGEVFSHPYATATIGKTTYVADAGANTVLAVNARGKVRKVAVLPAPSFTPTAQDAAALGVPACVAGHAYLSEPVPTDIEIGPGKKLYVSTLGGGLGEQIPLGTVAKINPKSGAVKAVADGLLAPAGLAVTSKRSVLVSSLFGGTISRVAPGGKVKVVLKAPLPAEVEAEDGWVYATTNAVPAENAPPAGKLVRFRS